MQRYREGQEDQLGALGLVVNAVCLRNSLYLDESVRKLRGEGTDVRDEDFLIAFFAAQPEPAFVAILPLAGSAAIGALAGAVAHALRPRLAPQPEEEGARAATVSGVGIARRLGADRGIDYRQDPPHHLTGRARV